ncbi:hypothetical protein T484DRAFT_3314046 [Baffinella frigidus]|nr:hypothetical protein T484DRAFT_3314046 [Cryptophyta sp. CCMP2293]
MCPQAQIWGGQVVGCGEANWACSPHLTVHIEMMCPPFIVPPNAVAHYKGTAFTNTTGGVTDDSQRGALVINGRSLPLAAEGDIPTCTKIDLECDKHFEMTKIAGAFSSPTCLQSGEWEPAQTCEPIWCEAYPPPPHGAVFPTSAVRAGDRVLVTCYEGYKKVWTTRFARTDPMCLDGRQFELGIQCAPLMCAAYEAPRHGSVSPSTGVRAGARVHISCDDGYKPLTIAMTDFGSDKAFGDVSTRIPEA